jgi:hypothetical protein
MMNPLSFRLNLERRRFLTRSAMGLGGVALASLLNPKLLAAESQPIPRGQARPGVLKALHVPAKAKRVIYLVMSGGPSQLDLFDYKPKLKELNATELPDSVRMGQRITGMTAGQKSFPCAASIFKFAQHGQSGRGSANCCRTRPRSPTNWPSSRRSTPRRSTTIRHSRSCKPARNSRAGRASARGSATAWGAKTTTCPHSS